MAIGQTDGKSFCTEESPLNPISLYGTTKILGENEAKKHSNYLIFRLATLFGFSTRIRTDLLINNLVLKAMKEKNIILYESNFMRNYIHIQDVCDAIIYAFGNWDNVKNEIFNLGNDQLNCSKYDLVKKIQEFVSLEIIKSETGFDPDKRNYIISSQKFYKKGYKCKYNLDFGIKELIKMYKLIDIPINANY